MSKGQINLYSTINLMTSQSVGEKRLLSSAKKNKD